MHAKVVPCLQWTKITGPMGYIDCSAGLTVFLLMCPIQDNWKAVDPYDDRRFYGNLYMKSIGQEYAASVTGLYAVLRTWPVRNNYTTYTAIMHPESFTMQSYDVY